MASEAAVNDGLDLVPGRRRPMVTLVALFIVAIYAWGLCFYGLGFYLQQLHEVRGWSIGALSTLTFGFYAAATYLSFPVSRVLAERGPQPVFFFGGVTLGAALLALPRVDNLAALALVYLLLAIGWSSISLNAVSTTVLAWYGERGQRPLTAVLIGASVGGIVVIPGLIELEARRGFTSTLTIAAVAASVSICALAVVAIRAPEPERASNPEGRQVGGDEPRSKVAWVILRTGRFWILSVGLATSAVVQAGFLVHQLTLLAETLDSRTAGRLVAVTTGAAMVGRFGLIASNDRFPTALAGAAFLVSQTAGLVVIGALPNTVPVLTIGCALFGLGVGTLISMPPLLARSTFPDLAFTSTYPIISTLFQIGIALGAPTTALARQLLGGYRPAVGVLAAIEAVAILLFILAHRASRNPLDDDVLPAVPSTS